MDTPASPADLNIGTKTSKGTKILSNPILSRDTFLQITFFFLRNYSWLQVTACEAGGQQVLGHGAGAVSSTQGGWE